MDNDDSEGERDIKRREEIKLRIYQGNPKETRWSRSPRFTGNVICNRSKGGKKRKAAVFAENRASPGMQAEAYIYGLIETHHE
ncbi:hypothetical protein KPH14_004921 [Odynerus spinipes]|uniref:Uncharacterized protein n=1 Tax=Odynerus spinipes TaxID=1348599 RepID=A0AAD9RMW9_9HYME|nr:hypothetical protein KPH14_004921 [Odynerus spinipes]